VSHLPCTYQDRVDSQLLVVRSQVASLTPDLSFDHNLCCKCPNGSCEAILDMYTSRPFQRCKEHLNASCFNPCNHVLSFWESQRTPKSHFRKCEWRPHISLKVGLRQLRWGSGWPSSTSANNFMSIPSRWTPSPGLACCFMWTTWC